MELGNGAMEGDELPPTKPCSSKPCSSTTRPARLRKPVQSIALQYCYRDGMNAGRRTGWFTRRDPEHYENGLCRASAAAASEAARADGHSAGRGQRSLRGSYAVSKYRRPFLGCSGCACEQCGHVEFLPPSNAYRWIARRRALAIHWVGRAARRVVAPLLGLSLLCACGPLSHGISPDHRPTGEEAFVYGRFRFHGPGSTSFVIGCDNQREYRIAFDDDQPIIAVAVEPSGCWILDAIFAGGEGERTVPLIDSPLYNMRLEPGKAYYVGDYDGESTPMGRMLHYEVTAPRDEFESTTKALLVEFPNLRSTPTVDQVRLCLDRAVARRLRESSLAK
jgi:hypothetical protein